MAQWLCVHFELPRSLMDYMYEPSRDVHIDAVAHLVTCQARLILACTFQRKRLTLRRLCHGPLLEQSVSLEYWAGVRSVPEPHPIAHSADLSKFERSNQHRPGVLHGNRS